MNNRRLGQTGEPYDLPEPWAVIHGYVGPCLERDGIRLRYRLSVGSGASCSSIMSPLHWILEVQEILRGFGRD